MAATRLRVFSGYRKLLRQARATFGDDQEALQGAKVVLREQLEENRGLIEPAKISEALNDIDDIIDQLRSQVVQAKLNDKGNYEMELPASEKNDMTAFEPLDLSDVDAIDKHLSELDVAEKMVNSNLIQFHPNDGSTSNPVTLGDAGDKNADK